MQLHRLPYVADKLDCHITTVRRLIESGDLAAVRVGKALRVPEDELARFIEANRYAGSGGAR